MIDVPGQRGIGNLKPLGRPVHATRFAGLVSVVFWCRSLALAGAVKGSSRDSLFNIYPKQGRTRGAPQAEGYIDIGVEQKFVNQDIENLSP